MKLQDIFFFEMKEEGLWANVTTSLGVTGFQVKFFA